MSVSVSWNEESVRYHPFISAPPDKKMREGEDESEAYRQAAVPLLSRSEDLLK